jgi:asparagine synthase (glutamine-hydrolysing)
MAQWSDDFTALLTDSVRLRLRSDVTVGSCLSGGLDSSTLVCLANRLLFPDGAGQHEIAAAQQTFSACFDDPAIDERRYMGAVVEATGVKWHSTFPRGEELFEQLNSILWHQDEPFLSTSIVAQWYVMRLARQRGVTVLLDGQGADELLCGYSGYFGPFFADLLKSAKLTELARELQLYDLNYRARWGSGVSMLARAMRAEHAWLRPQIRSRLDPGRVLPRWLAPDLARLHTTPGRNSAEEPDRPRGYLPATTKWQFEHVSLPSLLRYEDRNSMAFGVEARVPYLDYRLVEFVFRAPNALRIGDGMGKRVLRQAARGLIPETVRVRRDKLGFTTPEATWLRGPARECVERLLQRPSPAFKNYVKPEAAWEIWAAFLRGAPVDTGLIWRWVNLELWLRQAHLQP